MEHLSILGEIWRDEYPPNFPRKHSLIEKLLFTLILLVSCLSVANLKKKFGTASHDFMDYYVISWAVCLSLGLFGPVFLPDLVFAVLAGYRIVDITTYRAFFLLIKSQAKPWTPDLLRRSLVIALANFYELIVCFAILYRFSGDVVSASGTAVGPSNPISYFYFSLVTMVTLGYGDFVPRTDFGRLIVIGQLASTITFLIFLLPALMSVFSADLVSNQKKVR